MIRATLVCDSCSKELNLEASLHTLLQILSLTLFEKMPIQQTLMELAHGENYTDFTNQLNLFDS